MKQAWDVQQPKRRVRRYAQPKIALAWGRYHPKTGELQNTFPTRSKAADGGIGMRICRVRIVPETAT